MASEPLPLFPLEVVLFPGAPLPLHIFEPRYKLMIGRCLEERLAFGVVLAQEKGMAPVGCTAEIVKLVKRYEDGRMDILTVGRQRFRIVQVVQDEAYLRGEVEPLGDQEEPAPDPESAARLEKAFEQICRLLHREAAPRATPPTLLSFHIASELPLDLAYKQELLEMVSEAERQESLTEQLEAWVPRLERTERVRRRARGNGRGRS